MTKHPRPAALAQKLFSVHNRFRIGSLHAFNCRHENVRRTIGKLIRGSGGRLTEKVLGHSIEGRSISLLRFGTGPIRIFFWSQMHGDEPTATLALADLLNFLISGVAEQIGPGSIGLRCSLFFLPMVNPDGAARRNRYTAGWVDMNRDARRFSTPEARILRKAHRIADPSFGFNLHDQELSTVGQTDEIAALALLSPAGDPNGSVTPSRKRAMKVAALIAGALDELAGGRITRYDDTHEPRAFGDMVQSWRTSTVLIESGQWAGDPGKETIRKLNFAALLTAIGGIADGSYRRAALSSYTGLRENGKRAYGIILRNVTLKHAHAWSRKVSIGLELIRRGTPGKVTHVRVREIGDLRGFGSLLKIDAKGKTVGSDEISIDGVLSLARLSGLIGLRIPGNRDSGLRL